LMSWGATWSAPPHRSRPALVDHVFRPSRSWSYRAGVILMVKPSNDALHPRRNKERALSMFYNTAVTSRDLKLALPPGARPASMRSMVFLRLTAGKIYSAVVGRIGSENSTVRPRAIVWGGLLAGNRELQGGEDRL